MANFKPGDKVRLKPKQTSENEVLVYLSYDTVYTVGEARTRATAVRRDEPIITLVECSKRPLVDKVVDIQWLARRFELVEQQVAIPERDDEIEVVLRAKVSAVLRVDGVDAPRTVLYLASSAPGLGQQMVYLFDDHEDSVQSITVIKPAKPKLDLDALPEKAVVQATTGEIYVKRGVKLAYSWSDMKGGYFSPTELFNMHNELVELVRKEAA